eukprot:scaffold1224_cov191-Pinguiococcus_pyrenoidosus.AAC.3
MPRFVVLTRSLGLQTQWEVPPDACDPMHGIKDKDATVCCAKECGRCGGCKCSSSGNGSFSGASFCCPGTIRDDGLLCSTPDEVGCVLDKDAIYVQMHLRGTECDPDPADGPSYAQAAGPAPAPTAMLFNETLPLPSAAPSVMPVMDSAPTPSTAPSAVNIAEPMPPPSLTPTQIGSDN